MNALIHIVINFARILESNLFTITWPDTKTMSFRFKYIFGLLCSVILLITASSAGYAQKSRDQIEKEKRENQQKIQSIQGVLKQTSTKKQASLGQLKALSQQVNTQKKQIDLLNDDLKILNTELNTLKESRNKLDKDLGKLKVEYGQMIYEASKRNAYLNQLIFLFSSATFNQFVLRYKYLKHYTETRQGQVDQMQVVQAQISEKVKGITAKQEQQKSVLNTRLSEAQKLESLKSEQDQVVKVLSQQEKQLKEELAANRRAAAQLEATLRRIVERERKEREAREARERAERERLARERAAREKETGVKEEPVPEPASTGGMTTEELRIASSFMASQARLPWPVKGFVSDHFGRKPHPVLKGVMVDNLGVDIQTSSNEAVRAVYDGTVLDVTEMPGMGNVVAIQHGDYMTVYAKMKNVAVRAGQKIKVRESIGTVATNAEGTSELQFQIWKSTTRLNPELWLQRR